MQAGDGNLDVPAETEELSSYSDNTLNETIKPSINNEILEQNAAELDLNSYQNASSNNSCKNANLGENVVPNAQRFKIDASQIIIPSSTLYPQVLLPNISSISNEKFVTEEEIAESLKKKEETDSLSLNGSYISGSISQISGSFKTSKFDSSLNALMAKKNELINSIKSVLDNSSDPNIDVNINEENTNGPNISVLSDTDNLDLKAPNIGTSTPFRKSQPPAARFLKKWKPSFLNDEFQVVDEIDIPEEEESGYEKAMASLKEVLNDTTVDTASKLDSYSNILDIFKEEDAKKYDSMMLTITSEKSSLEECLEDATKEVDEFIEEFCEKNIGTKNNDTVITIDSKESTLVPSEQVVSALEDVSTATVSAKVGNTVITINSSQSENEVTVIKDQIPTKIAENDNLEVSKPENKENQIVGNENPPKENDPDILIIGGDDDLDINADDEDLLLASDDEGKEGKIEVKKIQPQVPLLKDLEVFVSNDENENRDNNDPKWDDLRNLGSDYEKYLAVRGRWRNIHIPNPKKDMTCRCRQPVSRYNGDTPIPPIRNEVRSSRKRAHSPENPYKFSKKLRRESCTILFDRSIDQLANDVKNERMDIIKEQDQALHELAEIQQIEKMITVTKGGTKSDMQRLEARHIMETRNCIDEYRRRMKETMESAQAKLIALRQASDEVRQFHAFYPNEEGSQNDKDSLVFLTETEVQEILEIEEMLLSFPSFYNA